MNSWDIWIYFPEVSNFRFHTTVAARKRGDAYRVARSMFPEAHSFRVIASATADAMGLYGGKRRF